MIIMFKWQHVSPSWCMGSIFCSDMQVSEILFKHPCCQKLLSNWLRCETFDGLVSSSWIVNINQTPSFISRSIRAELLNFILDGLQVLRKLYRQHALRCLVMWNNPLSMFFSTRIATYVISHPFGGQSSKHFLRRCFGSPLGGERS